MIRIAEVEAISNPIVSTKVFGVLAGADMPGELLAAWARSAQVVLAADAGADRLREVGASPHWIVGDMDSVEDLAHHQHAEIRLHTDQDSTDCDKLLALARELGYGQITLGGIEGDRMDHALATWLSAARSDLDVRLALRRGLGWILKAGRSLTVPSSPGSAVSLLPLSPSEGVILRGVHWPLEGRRLSWDGLVSISNAALGEMVEAEVGEGVAALIVEYPRAALPWW
jgi:thiamine pyrophosphokinase